MKKLTKFQKAKISNELTYYTQRILENMKTGMTMEISIWDDETIHITYYKN